MKIIKPSFELLDAVDGAAVLRKIEIENEKWKFVTFSDEYLVSSLGRVYSLKSDCFMKCDIRRNGYAQVGLRVDGKKHQYTVHRLVACAFIENPSNLPEVNHKDECRSNNRVENLEWCDRKYNLHYGSCLAKIADKRRGKRLSAEHRKKMSDALKRPVLCVDTGEIFDSLKSAGEKYGVTGGAIGCAIRSKSHISAGHKWRYADVEVIA